MAIKELVDLYHNFQPNPERIFESNVRGLQNSKKIPAQILTSLHTQKKASNFYKLHNGIAIVSDNIYQNSKEKFLISNPQIVNGCQTITTISEHYKNDRNAKQLEIGSVICKIFAANKNEVESICLASNSQVAISPADLRTNDDIQIILESFLNKKGIRYNRKSNRVSQNSSFTFKELGQWLCSCLLYRPAFAKNSRSKIYESSDSPTSVYDQIFNYGINYSEVMKIVRLGIFLKEKIKTVKNKTYEKPADLHLLTGMYYLQNRKNWSNEYTYKKINVRIRRVVEIIRDKNDKELAFPSIFTKYDETWIELKKLLDSELI